MGGIQEVEAALLEGEAQAEVEVVLPVAEVQAEEAAQEVEAEALDLYATWTGNAQNGAFATMGCRQGSAIL